MNLYETFTAVMLIALIALALIQTLSIFSLLKRGERQQATKRVFLFVAIQIGNKLFPSILVVPNKLTLSEDRTNMITVKATTVDTPFSVQIHRAADNEGNSIPAENFSMSTPVSDNAGAVEIVDYDATAQSGTLKFGSSNPDGTPNLANLSANVLDNEGNIVGVIGEQVAVTFGDVATFEGGFAIQFEEESDEDEDEDAADNGEMPVPTGGTEGGTSGEGTATGDARDNS